MNVNKIKIKYLRTNLSGHKFEFWSEREVGQVIEDSAFQGLVDEVLEIEVIK